MKIILLIHICLVAAIYGCREFRPDPVQEFIPGTYIRFSHHEFGNEYDTLVITLQNNHAHTYQIIRKWKYERTKEAPEYKRTVTAGIYYPHDKVMEDTDTGDLLSFDPRQRVLFTGSIKYKKL